MGAIHGSPPLDSAPECRPIGQLVRDEHDPTRIDLSRAAITSNQCDPEPSRKQVEVNQAEPGANRQLAEEDRAGNSSASASAHRRAIDVQPRHPPGRRSRKLRQFGEQIHKLHAAGYTLEDIREALADAGVIVSKSTVQREAARKARAPSLRLKPVDSGLPAGRPPLPPDDEPRTTTSQSLSRNQSARDLADEFFKSHPCNPLLRTEQP